MEVRASPKFFTAILFIPPHAASEYLHFNLVFLSFQTFLRLSKCSVRKLWLQFPSRSSFHILMGSYLLLLMILKHHSASVDFSRSSDNKLSHFCVPCGWNIQLLTNGTFYGGREAIMVQIRGADTIFFIQLCLNLSHQYKQPLRIFHVSGCYFFNCMSFL